MERRLSAIVAADVVDYSRRLSEDEVATLAALEDVRVSVIEPALSGTSGRVFRLLGDSTLIAFASVREAVEFAIALQEAQAHRNAGALMPMPIQYRIGINLGDVVTSGGEIHGEGINIAVRLESLAPPGGVCISEAIHSQIPADLATGFEALGARQLKNIAVPVAIWRWSPSAAGRARASGPAASNGRPAGGQQILDPKVTRLLVLLHMRSARLALSETVDEILAAPGAGKGLSLDDLYARLGDRLNQARALLADVNVRCVDNISEYSGGRWPTQLPLSEFITGVFDSTDTSYAFKILPVIRSILDSDDESHDRRISMMKLFENFMNTEMVPRTLSLIKYAFVDA